MALCQTCKQQKSEGTARGRKFCSIGCQAMAHVESQPDGHWRWTGAVRANGFGVIRVKIGKTWRITTPARVIYASRRGPVAAGEQVVAMCGMRTCVNPAHLEIKRHGIGLGSAA